MANVHTTKSFIWTYGGGSTLFIIVIFLACSRYGKAMRKKTRIMADGGESTGGETLAESFIDDESPSYLIDYEKTPLTDDFQSVVITDDSIQIVVVDNDCPLS